MHLRPVVRSRDQRRTAVWYSTKKDASSSGKEEVLASPKPTYLAQASSPHACRIATHTFNVERRKKAEKCTPLGVPLYPEAARDSLCLLSVVAGEQWLLPLSLTSDIN